MINWRKLLDQLNIEYIEGGKSTAKYNIYCKCPFCGKADEGTHMGISLRGRGFGCWRNPKHRGKQAWRLVAALADISPSLAMKMVGTENAVELVNDHSLSTKIGTMLMTHVETIPTKIPMALKFPKEIKPIEDKLSHKPFLTYLEKRGYVKWQALQICRFYKLHCTIDGMWKYRIIMPIYTEELGLTGWTGRSIAPDKEPRYMSLTHNLEVANGGPCALEDIKNCLFNERVISNLSGIGSNLFVLCEGPFDAMKIDYAGMSKNTVTATCLFGKTASDSQIEKLHKLSHNSRKKILLLDPDAALDNLAMWDKLKGVGFKVGKIPKGYEDPADMPVKAAVDWIYDQR